MAPVDKFPSRREPSLLMSRWWGKYQYRTGYRTEFVSSFRYRNVTPLFENLGHKSAYYGKQFIPWIVGLYLVKLGTDTLDEIYIDSHRADWP